MVEFEISRKEGKCTFNRCAFFLCLICRTYYFNIYICSILILCEDAQYCFRFELSFMLKALAAIVVKAFMI